MQRCGIKDGFTIVDRVDADQIVGFIQSKRYNMRQKQELLRVLQLCVAIINKAEAGVERLLCNWLYAEDVADYRNVR